MELVSKEALNGMAQTAVAAFAPLLKTTVADLRDVLDGLVCTVTIVDGAIKVTLEMKK